MADRPSCSCHSEPMLWQKDRRMAAGGRWECRQKRRGYNQRRTDNEALLERRRELWHAPGGGYVRRRRKELSAERERILIELDRLAKEAAECSAVTHATNAS